MLRLVNYEVNTMPSMTTRQIVHQCYNINVLIIREMQIKKVPMIMQEYRIKNMY